MNWVVKNFETDKILRAFDSLTDAQNFAKELNTIHQTNANRVKAFDLYFQPVKD